MSRGNVGASLLALDAGVRETGWAILGSGRQVSTGMIGMKGLRGIDAPARLAHMVAKLDQLADEWRPAAVAHSRPSGIPGLSPPWSCWKQPSSIGVCGEVSRFMPIPPKRSVTPPPAILIPPRMNWPMP